MILSGAGFTKYGSGVNIVFDGNSLVAGTGASGSLTYLPAQLAGLAPLSGAVTVKNLGSPGDNITDMRNRGAATDNAYVAGKKNILIAWEGTNTICRDNSGAGKTGLAAAADLVAWTQDRLAAHPDWKIVHMTTIPRFAVNTWGTDGANAQMQIYDDYLRNNWRAMGSKGVIDVRAAGVFVYTSGGPSATLAPYMAEVIHCNDAGYALIAQYCASALRRLPAR